MLSLAASTLMIAGGNIKAPKIVIPRPTIHIPPVVKAHSNWNYNGNAVGYYQTNDAYTNDIATGASTTNDIGLQLRAVNKNLFYGLGAGVELSGLYSNSDFSSGVDGANIPEVFFGNGKSRIQGAGNNNINNTPSGFGAAVTQAYLTYGLGNTSLKVGRQHLPKSLSPFAFTESWQPLKNSFDAALLVNTDLPNTTIVYAAVQKANSSVGNLSQFNTLNQDDVVNMVTVQNKSIRGLTYTGSAYYAADMIGGSLKNDVAMYWADLKFKSKLFGAKVGVAMQGGYIDGEEISTVDHNAIAGGMKLSGAYGPVSTSVAVSVVNESNLPVQNYGTGVKTPFYTQMILNQMYIKQDSNTIVGRAGVKLLGGKFGVAYNYSEIRDGALKHGKIAGTPGSTFVRAG